MRRIQIPEEYFQPIYDGLDESFIQFREELTTLFTNITSIASIQDNMIVYIGQTMEMMKVEYNKWKLPQREVILYLFNKLGIVIKDLPKILKVVGNPITNMIEIVFSIKEIFADHLIILISALEGIIRYSVYLETREDHCNFLVNFFISNM